MIILKEEKRWAIGRIAILLSILTMLTWTATAPGQLGMGDSKGIAQQRLKPRLVRITGKLQQIQTHPCENTTGKAELGTHLILKDKQGQELNIHLGPASEVAETVKRLTIGTRLDLLGFHTDKMLPNHYVAKTLILPNHIIQLRSSDLRPYWSTNRPAGQVPSPMVATTGKQRMSEISRSFRNYPKYWRQRSFRAGQRPRWQRRCRGRGCGRRWEWDH